MGKVKPLEDETIDAICTFVVDILKQRNILCKDMRKLLNSNGLSVANYKAFVQEFNNNPKSKFHDVMRKEKRIFANKDDEYYFVPTHLPNRDGMPCHIDFGNYTKMWEAMENIYDPDYEECDIKLLGDEGDDKKEGNVEQGRVYPTDPNHPMYTEGRFEFIAIVKYLNKMAPKHNKAIKMNEDDFHKALSDREDVIERFVKARDLGAFDKFLCYRPIDEKYSTADYIIKPFTISVPTYCERKNECISAAMVYDSLNL